MKRRYNFVRIGLCFLLIAVLISCHKIDSALRYIPQEVRMVDSVKIQSDMSKLDGFVNHRVGRYPIPNCIVYIIETRQFCITDSVGRFSVDLPGGDYRLFVSTIETIQQARFNVRLDPGWRYSYDIQLDVRCLD